MAHNDTGMFLSYWQALRRKAGQTPLRKAFDPVQLTSLLPSVFLLTARDGFRFRLVGERVERLHGTHLKGLPISHLFGESHKALTVAALTLARQREGALRLKVGVPLDMSDLTAELILVPLRGSDGLVDRFAGIYGLHGGWPTHFAETHPLDIKAPLAGPLSLHAAQIEDSQTEVLSAHTRLIVLNDRRVA
ncbi:PAS domain-containing protein [Asticcacaulis sp. DW145]|uniref:PAS domain-containing protein n=1 Tax=Asticcacaulis currens TaxID=2984210 RepID=A0ABT5IAN9_9CAUL|nr:PAS domain-containing protein [Asticcacaulis currens]MDC7693243.1 PAS domain-containing protein [Asticcacaulis currens]BEV09835.1 PAS domain-containing protein [Asticcacaulis sp. DW145]